MGVPLPTTASRRDTPALLENRFELVGEIGHGSMGRIYRARDLATDRLVALKEIQSDSPADRRLLLREFLAMRRARHPHVVRGLTLGLNGRFYTMELVDGEGLDQWFVGSGRDTESLAAVTGAILDALSALHRAGLVHLDIKPANLLVTTDPGGGVASPRIVDFGLARREVALRNAPLATGTLAYTAPEATGHSGADRRADLYSLGATLFHVLAERPLYPGLEGLELMEAHRSMSPDRLRDIRSDIPPWLDELVHSLLKSDPDERPTSARQACALLPPGAHRPAASHVAIRPKYVKRTAQANQVWAKLSSTVGGTGDAHLMLIGGAAGVGKSRFLEHFSLHARRKGLELFSGAWSPGADMPFAALVGVIRDLRRRVLHQAPDAAAAHDPGLLALLNPTDTEVVDLPDPDWLIDSATPFIIHALEHLPDLRALIVLEDAHWGDRPGLELVMRLARRLSRSEAAVAIVLAHRPHDDPTATSRLGDLLAQTKDIPVGEILLESLDSEGVARMAISLCGAGVASSEVVRVLADGSNGNPLTVTETVRDLLDGGGLTVTGNVLKATETFSPISGDGSDQLAEVVRRRAGRLRPEAGKILSMAAVFGTLVPYDGLAEVSRTEDETLLDILQELAAARLLVRDRERGFAALRFTHDRVGEVVYERLPAKTKKEYHLRAANAVEAFHADPRTEREAILGRHLFLGGDRERARAHLLSAAQRAHRFSDFPRAIQLYQRALECPGTDLARIQARTILGDLYRLVGEADASARELNGALASAFDHTGRPLEGLPSDADLESLDPEQLDAVGSLLNAIGSLHVHSGEVEAATAAYQTTLKIRERSGDPSTMAGVKVNLAVVAGSQGDVEKAVRLLEECVEDARKFELDQLMGPALVNLGHFLHLSGKPEQALDIYTQTLGQPGIQEDPHMESLVLGNIGEVLQGLGRAREALEHHERSLVLRASINDTPGRLYALVGIGLAQVDLGRYQDAIANFEESVRIAQNTGSRVQWSDALHNLGDTLLYVGRYDEARDRFERALELRREVGEPRTVAHTLKGLAVLTYFTGDLRRAAELADESARIALEAQDPRAWAAARFYCGRINLARGRIEDARTATQASLDRARELVYGRGIVRALIVLGEIHLEDGRIEDAERSLGEALDLAIPLENDKLRVEVQLLQATALAQRKQWAEAEKLLDECATVSERLGNVSRVAMARRQAGIVAAERGRLNRADRELKAAAETFAEIGRLFEEARTLLAWGRLDCDFGDEDAGGPRVEKALRLFQQIGSEHYAKKAAAVLDAVRRA